MSDYPSPYWCNRWKNATSDDWMKTWNTGWKNWVPDPAKTYVYSDSDLPIKVNPIFKGQQNTTSKSKSVSIHTMKLLNEIPFL